MYGWRLIIATLLVGGSLSVALAELYRLAAIMGLTDPNNQWIAAAIVNSLLAAVVAGIMIARRIPPDPVRAVPANAPWVALIRRWWFVPSLIVVVGAASLAGLSSTSGAPQHAEVPIYQWCFVVWIPLVEEFVFRGGIGRWMRSHGGWMWGSYVSALVFSFVHSSPDISNILAGKIGLPLGPFLLGVCCEILYAASGKLSAAVLFHMACNATPAIFASIDARWLEWLSGLYS